VLAFTAAEQSQLRGIFRAGIGDYTQPGIGQQLIWWCLLVD
jgi:hypothetical protein